MELDVDEIIEYLVFKKYPLWKYAEDSLIDQRKMKYSGIPSIDLIKIAETSHAYRVELKEKTTKDLEQTYIKEKDEENKREKIYFQIKKKEFNEKIAKNHIKADFSHWSKMSSWSFNEALALAFGKEPEFFDINVITPYLIYSSVAKKYKQLNDLMMRACNNDELNQPIQPLFFIRWVEQNGFFFPKKLKKMVISRPNNPKDWKIAYEEKNEEVQQLIQQNNKLITKNNELLSKNRGLSKERNTCLKILAAIMQDRYKYPHNSAAMGTMLSYLDKLGISIDDQTLRSHLDKGLKIIENKN